jgi:hypothetical protein
MAILHSPLTVMDGLVFYYDQNNIKSYKGPPIQNLASLAVIGSQSSAGFSSIPGSETVDIPQVGRLSVNYKIIQNNYPAVSNNCCPSLFTYSPTSSPNGFSVSPSTLYTYSIVYKCDSGYTHPNYMYRYEYTAQGGSFVTESGIHSDSNRIELGNGWYWAWGTFTTQATTNWIGYSGLFYYRWVTTPDKVTVAKVLITPGNYTGLHPKYWPDPTTTRSNTQVLSDLTGNNSITATSLTYASDSTFSFNGSSNELHPTISHSYLNSSALEVIFNSTSHGSGYKTIFGYRHNPGYSLPTIGSLFLNGNTLTASVITTSQTYRTATAAESIATNKYYYVVLNKNTFSGLLEIYVNGTLSGTQTFDAATYGQWSTAGNYIGADLLDIGKSTSTDVGQGWGTDYFTGVIPVAKVYNRTLSLSEIQQNFTALRGRFNL